ncbi:hypothetical protein KIPB_006455 [Kipferlia bialata]|uniref:Uncharacterized protein n=1 Tax=Kipferlia bialata TaxID=797122 RepID=A0A9K3CYK6_9EUKA|nr:hypothetical protein KIPB_006455 [Kipferlia bialata]|eukprot:g6455.t1
MDMTSGNECTVESQQVITLPSLAYDDASAAWGRVMAVLADGTVLVADSQGGAASEGYVKRLAISHTSAKGYLIETLTENDVTGSKAGSTFYGYGVSMSVSRDGTAVAVARSGGRGFDCYVLTATEYGSSALTFVGSLILSASEAPADGTDLPPVLSFCDNEGRHIVVTLQHTSRQLLYTRMGGDDGMGFLLALRHSKAEGDQRARGLRDELASVKAMIDEARIRQRQLSQSIPVRVREAGDKARQRQMSRVQTLMQDKADLTDTVETLVARVRSMIHKRAEGLAERERQDRQEIDDAKQRWQRDETLRTNKWIADQKVLVSTKAKDRLAPRVEQVISEHNTRVQEIKARTAEERDRVRRDVERHVQQDTQQTKQTLRAAQGAEVEQIRLSLQGERERVRQSGERQMRDLEASLEERRDREYAKWQRERDMAIHRARKAVRQIEERARESASAAEAKRGREAAEAVSDAVHRVAKERAQHDKAAQSMYDAERDLWMRTTLGPTMSEGAMESEAMRGVGVDAERQAERLIRQTCRDLNGLRALNAVSEASAEQALSELFRRRAEEKGERQRERDTARQGVETVLRETASIRVSKERLLLALSDAEGRELRGRERLAEERERVRHARAGVSSAAVDAEREERRERGNAIEAEIDRVQQSIQAYERERETVARAVVREGERLVDEMRQDVQGQLSSQNKTVERLRREIVSLTSQLEMGRRELR